MGRAWNEHQKAKSAVRRHWVAQLTRELVELVERRRLDMGLTREEHALELGQEMGLSAQAVSRKLRRWSEGAVANSISDIDRFAVALDMHPGELPSWWEASDEVAA